MTAKNPPSSIQGRCADPVFLDRIQTPTLNHLEEADRFNALSSPPAHNLAAELKARIAQHHRLPPETIRLFSGIDECLWQSAKKTAGSIVVLTPSLLASQVVAETSSGRSVAIARGPGLSSAVDIGDACDIPHDSLALADSPTNPLGFLLSAGDGVRLARASRLLVIDERFADCAGFTLIPLAVEFENVVVLRTFECWLPSSPASCSWAAGSPHALDQLELNEVTVEAKALTASLAALHDRHFVELAFRQVREERSRLFRFLRKLSFLTPLPSWGPFLAARVELVSREAFVSSLCGRGVHVHAPQESGLEQFVRIGIGPRPAMDRFYEVLLEVAPKLIGDQATPRPHRLELPHAAH